MNSMGKYTVIQHKQHLHWLKDCPVLLQSYALTKDNTDNSILLQCKFENIADKPIKAMNIAVRCSDISYQKLEKVDSFSYLDINIQPYSLFGDTMPVYLPNNMTRNVHIIPLKVIFSDDITWENTSEQTYELAEYEQQPISSLGELADQYKRDLHDICSKSNAHTYLPARKDGFTICGCGKIILDTAKSCPACGVSIDRLFALNNEELLTLANEFYEQNQREQAEQKKKQAVILQIQQSQAELNKKQLYKKIRITIGVLLLIVIVLFTSATYSHKLHKQELLQKTQAVVNQMTQMESDDIQISSSIKDNVITFTISIDSVGAEYTPKTLSEMTRHDLISIRNNPSQLDSSIKSWLSLKDTIINLQNNLLSAYANLGGSNTYSIQTIINAYDGVTIFEFDGNTLTYDYWEEMEGYRYNKTQLVSDINEILN